MTDKEQKDRRLWLRLACILPGLGLIAWALADGPMIGGGPGIGMFDGLVLIFGAVTAAAGLLPTRFAANYLAFFGMIMLTLVVTEVFLQTFFRGQYFASNNFDERVLFKLRPGASRAYTHLPANGGETIVFHVNSDGYIGPELLPQGTRPRIVVFGDSFTNAEFSPLEERFTTRLQDALGSRLGTEVEVINAGIAGYGPDQILRRMQTELAQLKPDLVIVNVFTGNDFGDLLRNRLYRLGVNGELTENGYQLTPQQQRTISLNRHELVLLRVLKNAKRKFSAGGNSHFENFDAAGWIDAAYEQHLREYNEFVVQGNNTVGEFSVDPYSADIATDPESPSSQYKIRLMTKVIAGMKGEAKTASVPLLLVGIPHPMDLLDGDHASGRIDRTKYPGYMPTQLTDTISAIATDLGIVHVNLFPPFAATDANELYLKGGDDHWNGAGQSLAAEIVADVVIGNGFLSD